MLHPELVTEWGVRSWVFWPSLCSPNTHRRGGLETAGGGGLPDPLQLLVGKPLEQKGPGGLFQKHQVRKIKFPSLFIDFCAVKERLEGRGTGVR